MVWKKVKGFEGFYEISSEGSIRSIERWVVYSKGTRKLKSQTCKSRINNRGYAEVRLSKNGLTYTKLVHILSAEVFITNPLNKSEVNHLDGNKLNNCSDNLEWTTHSENILHAYKIGLINRGTKKIVDSCSGKMYSSAKEASKIYNINYNTLRCYLNGGIKTNPTCLKYAA